MLACFTLETANARPIHVMTQSEFVEWLNQQGVATKMWLTDSGFKAEAGNVSVVPGDNGQIALVVCCVQDKKNLWQVGGLSSTLPEGCYHFVNADDQYQSYAVSWGLGAYQFVRYKKPVRAPAKLILSAEDIPTAENIVSSIYTVRDLINTPTEDMGPTELANEMQKIAKEYQADFSQIVGDELLKKNYPAIHAVGRASDDAPRLLNLRWGDSSHPKVTLVGKGVCFDTGGLDLKPSQYMLLMKKDMGGAANVLGLARMIMCAKLPVDLRVIIPAVENAVSGNAYRPGDVIKSRKGLTIEIGNTDAEGRVVLADALTEAASEKPALLIDLSTLTGAARVALGTDLPAIFSNNNELADAVIAAGGQQKYTIRGLPLFFAY